MKKKYFWIGSTFVVIIIIIVVIIVRYSRRWRKVELTDSAKEYVQFWDISKKEAVRKHYLTGADKLVVDMSSPKTVTDFTAQNENWYIPGSTTFYPVKKGIFPNGCVVEFNPNENFVNTSSLKPYDI